MWIDVLQLRDWYQSYPGRVARRVVRRALKDWLPPVGTGSVLGLGFAQPYLKDYQDDRQTVLAMPARMGVIHWPRDHANRVVLTWEAELPFADNTFDYIVLAHCLEFTADPATLLQECWRVLRPEGRLLIVAPNRSGAWARRENSPFGQGHPYGPVELGQLFRAGDFMMTQSRYALFAPPTTRRWVLEWYETWEKIGSRWCAMLGGVLLMEGRKDVYGMRALSPRRRWQSRVVGVPIPAGISGLVKKTMKSD